VPLNSISIGEGELITIERCEQCQGMFFNPGELEYVLVNSIPIVYTIDRERITALKREAAGNNRESRYIKCPACAELMNYINYKKESGVIVDWCKLHGLWLDGGELRQLLEWRKAGGMLKYEQNQSSFSKMPPPPSTRLQPQDSSRKPKMDLETYRRKDYNENDITGLIGNIISEILFRW
jgi:Zn-finger nucleic acid-binding protein